MATVMQLPWGGSSQCPIPTCSLLQRHRDVSWLCLSCSSFLLLVPPPPPRISSLGSSASKGTTAVSFLPVFLFLSWPISSGKQVFGTISISRHPPCQAQPLSSSQPLWGTALPRAWGRHSLQSLAEDSAGIYPFYSKAYQGSLENSDLGMHGPKMSVEGPNKRERCSVWDGCPELPGDPGVGRTFPGRAGQQLQHSRKVCRRSGEQPASSGSLWLTLTGKPRLKLLPWHILPGRERTWLGEL